MHDLRDTLMDAPVIDQRDRAWVEALLSRRHRDPVLAHLARSTALAPHVRERGSPALAGASVGDPCGGGGGHGDVRGGSVDVSWVKYGARSVSGAEPTVAVFLSTNTPVLGSD
jgi:hypothetical protein